MPPGHLRDPGPLGTVDTVAGPGFCTRGLARPDPAPSQVGALTADTAGTLWFESGASGDGLVTKVVSSNWATVARTGVESSGPPRRDGAANAARLASASRLAADHLGGVLIAVPTAVLRLAHGLETLAGVKSPTSEETPPKVGAGDGGSLREARFVQIMAIATDAAGNVYVADQADDGSIAIRFLNRSGEPVTFYRGTTDEVTVAPDTIDTIAGGGGRPGEPLVGHAPVLAGAADRLYVATALPGSRHGAVVRMLNLGGGDLSAHGVTTAPAEIDTVTTVSSPADVSVSGAVSALPDIAADDEGNLFLAEQANNRVTRVDQEGTVTAFAGTGAAGFDSNDRPATQARLDRPYDVDVGAGGRVYISDSGNAQIRVVDQAGVIRAAPGNGITNRWVCDDTGAGMPRPGEDGTPTGLAADPAGNVYISTNLGQLYRLAPSATVRPVAGSAPGSCTDHSGCPSQDGGPPKEVHLPDKIHVASAPPHGLYVMDVFRVRLLNLATRPVEVHGVAVAPNEMRTVAGASSATASPGPSPTPSPSPSMIEIPGTGQRVAVPRFPVPAPTIPDGQQAVAADPGVGYTALAVDGRGNLIVGDVPLGPGLGNGSVRQVDASGVITTLVSRPGQRPDGTPDPTVCCNKPSALVTDAAANLYIADGAGRRVWFLNRGEHPVVVHGVRIAPGALETVAGAGENGSQDERIPAVQARLGYPEGVAVDESGNLYVADWGENVVQRIDAEGTISTVVGTGQPGFNGDGLNGQLTALHRPGGLLLDECGNLLIADSGNHRVRRLNLAGSCPVATAAVAAAPASPAVGVALGAAAVLALALALGWLLSRRRGHVTPPLPRSPRAH